MTTNYLIDKNGIINKDNVKIEFERLCSKYDIYLIFEEYFKRLQFNWSNDIKNDWADYINDYGEGWSTNKQFQNNEMFFYDGEVWCSMCTLDIWYSSSDTTKDDKIIYSIAYDIIEEFHKLNNIEAIPNHYKI